MPYHTGKKKKKVKGGMKKKKKKMGRKRWEREENLMTFDILVKKVLKHEGGYVNDPSDPGGETKYGISKRAFPDLDIKNLTEEQAILIYYDEYWLDAKVDKLPDELHEIYLDMVVNMGKQECKVLE